MLCLKKSEIIPDADNFKNALDAHLKMITDEEPQIHGYTKCSDLIQTQLLI